MRLILYLFYMWYPFRILFVSLCFYCSYLCFPLLDAITIPYAQLTLHLNYTVELLSTTIIIDTTFILHTFFTYFLILIPY